MTFKNHDAAYYEKAADILYGKTTPGEKRKTKERRYSLGQSIYDDEDEEETKKYSLDKPEEKENPEDILYNHPTSQPKKKGDDKIDGMQIKDKAKTKEEEEQELLDLMYDHPTSQPGYRQNSEKERIEKDKIKQPEYDDEEGVVTGGAAPQKRSIKGKVEYNVYKESIKRVDKDKVKAAAEIATGPNAAEMLQMSHYKKYMDNDFSKKHKIYNTYLDVEPEERDYYKGKIEKAVGAKNINSVKGIEIASDSEFSKDLAKVLLKSEDFIEILKQKRKELEKGKIEKDTIQFKDDDFRFGIGKCDLRNIRINKSGDIELDVSDIYDFPEKSDNMLNQVGRELQDKGILKPYFLRARVVIPKNSKIEN